MKCRREAPHPWCMTSQGLIRSAGRRFPTPVACSHRALFSMQVGGSSPLMYDFTWSYSACRSEVPHQPLMYDFIRPYSASRPVVPHRWLWSHMALFGVQAEGSPSTPDVWSHRALFSVQARGSSPLMCNLTGPYSACRLEDPHPCCRVYSFRSRGDTVVIELASPILAGPSLVQMGTRFLG